MLDHRCIAPFDIWLPKIELLRKQQWQRHYFSVISLATVPHGSSRGVPVQPADGVSQTALMYRYDEYDLDRLRQDCEEALRGWSWEDGAFGHTLSLPAMGDLAERGKTHYNNIPFTNRLTGCPYFQEIFHSFECDIISYRLLRREPNSLYGLHEDRDKGPKAVRFQIPIVSEGDSFMIATDYTDMRDLPNTASIRGLSGASAIRGSKQRLMTLLDEFIDDTEGKANLYELEPGWLYFFNTDNVHTLVNLSSTERIVLAIDCIANPWLLERYPHVAAVV